MYEYQCTRCQRRVEKIQSYSAEPLTVCESCGGPLEKLISAAAIQFKGTGWYVTDYAKKSSAASSSPSGEGKSGGKSEGGESQAGAAKADSAAAPPAGGSPAPAAGPPAAKTSESK
ncbi:MAG TPA: FmdB family zinc ribbon protein [Terriglobales bacterium]|nr:FmdB family zinc ribbon protein [Terriglobales bacterium]